VRLEGVEGAGDLSTGNVMLQGDLSSINLLRSAGGETALVDWNDASVGPADHEFISPFMHQFHGTATDLAAFWSGYGSLDDPETTRHRIMARSIVKYATLMPTYLAELDRSGSSSWQAVAESFTGIR
jgi:aminoglycoside phosphotransferase (APT) family kinase protein